VKENAVSSTRELLAETGAFWRGCGAIAAAIFPIPFLFLPAARVILQIRHAEGSDDHGQICPEGQAEQEGSEGTEPPAADHVGFQPRYQNR